MVYIYFIIAALFIVLFFKKNKAFKALELEKTQIQNEKNNIANDLVACNESLSKYKQSENIDNDIQEKMNKADKLRKELSELHSLGDLSDQKKKLLKDLDELIKEDIILTSTPFTFNQFKSEEYKTKLSLCKNEQAELIKNGKAAYSTGTAGTKKEISDNIKQILRCFNAECEAAFIGLSVKNSDSRRAKINKSYEVLNKIFGVDNVTLDKKYLELKLEELNLYYAYDQQLQIEKEDQKAIREQLMEEEKLRREIEQAKKKIEKEESQFKGEIDKLMGYMQKADDIEKQLYVDKIKELEERLKLVEKDKENVFQREQNTRAGYVYIISNIGSFGENVYKIGMTRRLDPMDRVKELGDASVPFPFDVHALIFSEDAPGLETVLHQTFRKYEVNKINPRKEFFKLPLDEIKDAVKNKHNATTQFIDIPEAEQYRAGLDIA
ncbi:MAG: DUF4041 domain-containing protein [Clostridiales bacterium]